MNANEMVNIRYIVDDVAAAVDFYTRHFAFKANVNAAPAFADVVRGNIRILLSGPKSSAGRAMPDGVNPEPGGWNRLQLITEDIDGEYQRLKGEGVPFRNEIISGPGGKQVLAQDPAGNFVELFEPAANWS
jgi:predicted enzyme related to lactoylglutathione lyase